jgi:hypothetical protein
LLPISPFHDQSSLPASRPKFRIRSSQIQGVPAFKQGISPLLQDGGMAVLRCCNTERYFGGGFRPSGPCRRNRMVETQPSMWEGGMVFPKLPDVADAQAQTLPLIVAPYLWWAFMGDMWAATLEFATSPLRADRANKGESVQS